VTVRWAWGGCEGESERAREQERREEAGRVREKRSSKGIERLEPANGKQVIVKRTTMKGCFAKPLHIQRADPPLRCGQKVFSPQGPGSRKSIPESHAFIQSNQTLILSFSNI
jgi:hypothetical protein